MKYASPGLTDILARNQFLMVETYTFTLVTGTILCYATSDRDLTHGDDIYYASKSLFSRSHIHWKTGIEVDTLDITVYPRQTDLVMGFPFLHAIKLGLFDGATVDVNRWFMTVWNDTQHGNIAIFPGGRVADIECGRTSCLIHVNSWLELLNVQTPGTVYEPSCVHTLYDAGCALSRAAWVVAGTVEADPAPTTDKIVISGTGHGAGYFDQGTLTFTSGSLNGIEVDIKQWTDAHEATFLKPLPKAPEAGDTVDLAPGCPRTEDKCASRFDNLANFLGFPFVPIPETAI